MLLDLHLHARPASRDAFDEVEALAAALAAAGAGGGALTDHGPGCDYASAMLAFERCGLLLVPGRELSTPLGHVLVLTTDVEWLARAPEVSPLPLPETPSAPYALIWAHPAGWRVAGALAAPDPSRGAEHVHGVEVLNGERLYQQDGVAMAEHLAVSLGKAATGGSDAHRAEGAGKCLTELDATDAAGVVDAVRAGACAPVLGAAWAERHGMVYERTDLRPYRR